MYLIVKQVKQLSFLSMLAMLALYSSLSFAEQNEPGALATVQQVTDKLTERLNANQDKLHEDAVRKQIINDELVPLIDLKRITRSVMGEGFKVATKEQRYAFLEAFKASLIDTYAAGLASYNGQKFILRAGPTKGAKAIVNMQIQTATNPIDVAYTLYQGDDKNWRLINLVVNGVNLGKTYRNQFAQLMDIHQGDIDAAIANWSLKGSPKKAAKAS